MKQMVCCSVCAVCASVFTLWMSDSNGRSIANAQGVQVGPQTPPALLRPSTPAKKTALPKIYNADGLTPDEAASVYIYERNTKSVANITTRSVRSDGFFLFDESSKGTGSGSVLDKQGHVLTNYHVIEDAREVKVTLYDGKTYDARLVGADPINDTAVLRVTAPLDVLHPIAIGDSANLRVGMQVYAIGNPFGLERTMSKGIISSLNRSLQVTASRSIKSMIQIDAAINPGNSGGPLLDSHGRLIGMNTAIASRTGQSSGVGFAIPVNLISRVVPQLIRHGRVIRPEIGIQRVYETEAGLLITRLTPNGPADQAGLKGPQVVRQRRAGWMFERVDRSAADLIIAVDEVKTATVDDFLSRIEEKQPGDTVVVTVIRAGEKVNVTVQLGGGLEE
jgi:S1-C subfamily serine protease